MQTVDADYQLLTYPARKWKQRMQLSTPCFVERLARQPVAERAFDTVLCSTFGMLVARLQQLLVQRQRLSAQLAESLSQRFEWQQVESAYRQWLLPAIE